MKKWLLENWFRVGVLAGIGSLIVAVAFCVRVIPVPAPPAPRGSGIDPVAAMKLLATEDTLRRLRRDYDHSQEQRAREVASADSLMKKSKNTDEKLNRRTAAVRSWTDEQRRGAIKSILSE